MTPREALERVESTLADGIITAAVEDYAFWECIRDALEYVVEALEKQLADGCEGCKYIHKDEYEMPCFICKRNKIDKWTEDRK